MRDFSIAEAVACFKGNWGSAFECAGLVDVLREIGHKWRHRLLPPAKTVELFLLQILHGNTAITHLRHLSRMKFSASAYCQARARLPLELLRRMLAQMRGASESQGHWHGHRTLLVDGSTFSMPDTTELRKRFGQPKGQKKGCGFPTGNLLCLFNAASQMLIDLVPAKLYTHDLRSVVKVHPLLERNDILVADRAFCSFAHVALLFSRGAHALLRKHYALKFSKKQLLQKTPILDFVTEWRKPRKPCRWMSKAQHSKLLDQITVRIISYRIAPRGFRSKQITLLTTLLDPARYPAHELAALYRVRWSIETNFAHLKTTMQMDVLRSKTIAGILKEIYAFAITYNMVRIVMNRAASRQGVPLARLSFIDALRCVACAVQFNTISLLILVNPLRPNRLDPRAVKRRPKQYDLLNKPRKLMLKSQLRARLS